MKIRQRTGAVIALSAVMILMCILACFTMTVGRTKVNAQEGAPASDLVVQMDVQDAPNVTVDVSNPNQVAATDIKWVNLIHSSWAEANNLGLFTHFGNESNLKVAVLFRLNTPVEAKYFGDMEFKFYPGGEGTLYMFKEGANDLSPTNAKASMEVKKYAANTVNAKAADFAGADGLIREFTLLMDRTKVGDWFFGRFKFTLNEELIQPAPTENKLLVATDGADSPILFPGRNDANKNVNGLKDKYTFAEKIVENKYQPENYGYYATSVFSTPFTASLIKLKTPMKAADFEKVSLTFRPGCSGQFALYASTAEKFTAETAAGSVYASKAHVDYTIEVNAADLANADGLITDITLGVSYLKTTGQVFYKNIKFIKADGAETVMESSELNGLFTTDASNPNKVDLQVYNFIFAVKNGWADAGMGLMTPVVKAPNTALVMSFAEPINAAHYDRIELTFYSGMKGRLEFYSSKDNVLESHLAKAVIEETEQGAKNTIKLNTSDFADESGFVNNITIFSPNTLKDEAGARFGGQLFFAEAKLIIRTETSYLDELVLTDATEKSLVVEEGSAAEFIGENIPEAIGEKGAYDAAQALKITGKTTITFKKEMNQKATEIGNIVMRFYLSDNSDVTKITLTPAGKTEPTETIDLTERKGWFDVTASIMNYLNEDGNIGGMILEKDGKSDLIFGGATVEDKLRELSTDIAKADISEVLPMTENGITYTSTEKVNYVPMFERKDMKKNVVSFKLKVSDLSDFNVMVALSGVGETTNGIWFWFDCHGPNMITGLRTSYPASVKANEWFEVELGAIPYTVNFMPYGTHGYIKINGEIVLEGNIDTEIQPTGEWFTAYVHQTKPDTTVSIAPVNYTSSKVAELAVESGKTELTVGETDRLLLKKNMILNGQTISDITVKSGDSVTVDADGYITAVKKGVTVFKVTASAVGSIPEQETEISVSANKFLTVKIDGKSQKVEEGGKLVLPKTEAPEGYEFVGLFLDKECTQKFDYENTAITEDLTLYTGFSEIKSGCGSSVVGGAAVFASVVLMIGVSGIMIRKKKGN